jgi:hypothetical protein
METLRRARRCARLLLAWFALSLGVALAAPVLHPLEMQLVCSGSGAGKLVAVGDEPGHVAGHTHTQDCSMCVLAALPPPSLQLVAHPLPIAPPGSFQVLLAGAQNPSPFAARAPPEA